MLGEGYKILSIPTKYGKYHFRSKLEAQWAVFMDVFDVKYEYEPDCEEVEVGFRSVVYKPDFFLNDLQVYVEIKPRKPLEKELVKAAGWANDVCDIIILTGLKPLHGYKMYRDVGDMIPTFSKNTKWGWCECPRCLKVDICEQGLPTCGCYDSDELGRMALGDLVDIEFHRTQNIIKAFKIANNFKFESNARASPLKRRFSLYYQY